MGSLVGWLPMVVLIGFVSLVFVSGGSSGAQMMRADVAQRALQEYTPVAVTGWKNGISSEVASNGVDGPFTAPASLGSMSLCDVNDSSCGISGSTTYNVSTNSGTYTNSITRVQRAGGSSCSAAQGYVAGQIIITITDSSGDVLGTNTLTVSGNSTCNSPYYYITGISDSQGIAMDTSGNYQTAGTFNGCTSAVPGDCDTLQGTQGSSTASDLSVHGVLTCSGKYCNGTETPKPVPDNFQTLTKPNSGVGTGLAP